MSIQYRSNLQSIIKTIKEYTLTPLHQELLQQTPFWLLIESIINGKLNINDCKKSEKFIYGVLSTYNKSSNGFQFGNKHLMISETDVRLIFGIRDGPASVELATRYDPYKSDFITRTFTRPKGKKLELTKVMIETALASAMADNSTEHVKDACRLIILHMLLTIFVSAKNQTLRWSYVPYVEEIDRMKNYNWSAHIYDHLQRSIHSNAGHPEHMTGCIVAIPFWICERLGYTKPIKMGFPRCIKWKMLELPDKINTKILQEFAEKAESTGLLVQTEEETRLLTFSESNEQGLGQEDDNTPLTIHLSRIRCQRTRVPHNMQPTVQGAEPEILASCDPPPQEGEGGKYNLDNLVAAAAEQERTTSPNITLEQAMDRIAYLEDEVKRLKSANQCIEEHNMTLQNKVDDLTNILKSPKDHSVEIEDMQNELERLKQALQNRDYSIQELQKAIDQNKMDNLANIVNSQKHHSVQIEDMQNELNKLKQELQTKDSSIQELQKAVEELQMAEVQRMTTAPEAEKNILAAQKIRNTKRSAAEDRPQTVGDLTLASKKRKSNSPLDYLQPKVLHKFNQLNDKFKNNPE